jgi:hypothetical protein
MSGILLTVVGMEPRIRMLPRLTAGENFQTGWVIRFSVPQKACLPELDGYLICPQWIISTDL